MKKPPIENPYLKRFSEKERGLKERLWRILIDTFLNRFIERDKTIIDLGCGFCEFINTVQGETKFAYDIDASFEAYASDECRFIKAEENAPIPLPDDSVDYVFASNFFEHVKSRDQILFLLEESLRILKRSGKIVILQPNIALIGESYWDFFDHIIPLTDKGLNEALEWVGFRTVLTKKRFLPYTTKSRLPSSPFFLKVYLRLPILHFFLGKQSLIIGEKP